ncbi:MAG TPA: ABC transporter permease [Longimicrobiales bacterium]|jgi:putative ABC transport system permease protein
MPAGGGRALAASVRLYRLLLRSYPAEFRRRHEAEMVLLFREKGRDAFERGGLAGLVIHGIAAVKDVATNALAERAGGGGTGRRGGGMETLWKDVSYGVRALARAPGFAAVAILTVGLGIGANTAIFSVVRAVLLQPLPYDSPDRLAMVWGEMRNRNVDHFPVSPPDLRDFRAMSTTFDDFAGVVTFMQPLTGDFEPEQINVGGVTPNFFQVLGVRPLLGRDFVASDGDPADPSLQPGDPGFITNSAILSHGLWQRRFGADPGVVGTVVQLAGSSTEIVGVMPDGFELLLPSTAAMDTDAAVWVALRLDFDSAPRNNVFLRVLGRLNPGVGLARAQADMDGIAARLRSLDAVWETSGYAIEVAPLGRDLTATARPVIWALMGAVAFVLLIACANVSNLLLVRASTRARELAVRAALGGSRWRILRQLLSESVLLALAGAVLGLVLARVGISVLLALQPGDLPRINDVTIDGGVLGFTFLAALAAAVLFGAAPALQASRVDLAESLKDRGRTAALTASRLLRNGVVVVEVALSVVLLVGAGLMVRSFASLQRVDPGFEPEGLLTFGVSLPFASYPDARERAQFANRLQERLEGLPGVEAATGAFPMPLTDVLFNSRWGLEEALTDPQAFRQADYHSVLPGFFETLRMELVAGRTFTHADNVDSTGVVLVDRKLAEIAFPGRSAVGERILIRLTTPEPEWVEIVGVVENRRHGSLAEEGRETVYFTDVYSGSFGNLTWAVRGGGDPGALARAVREEVATLDPGVPVSDVRPMTDFVRDQMASTRFTLVLIAVFGALAWVLAAVGLYGVLAYVVRQRTAEIGVRMAFGAQAGSILKLVVGQGMALAGAGVAVGLLAAFNLTRLMSSFLVGVEPTDPATFAIISGAFVVVAGVACWLPARRAARTDPAEALRGD